MFQQECIAHLPVTLSLGVHPCNTQEPNLEAHGRGQVQKPVRHVLAQQGLFVALRITAVNGELQLILLVEQCVLYLRLLEIQPQGREVADLMPGMSAGADLYVERLGFSIFAGIAQRSL